MLTTLAERWHSNHNTFHIATREMTVTPKDVYRILRIPVVGDIMTYDHIEQGGIDALHQIFHDDHIAGYEMPWQEMFERYAPLPSMLARFVGGFLCPDKRAKGLSVGWDWTLEQMIRFGARFTWGSCMLTNLYHDLHQVVYLRGASLSAGVTLLQTWDWEHIVVT